MATPAPSPRPNPAGPSATWARSGEPGSAFNGLSRGRGRGTGRGRGGRDGRGDIKESKPIGADHTGDKAVATSKNAPTPASKPVALPPPSPVPPNASGSARSKGNSRRASRTIPAVVLPQLNAAGDVPNSPTTSRPQNRRRRSQSGRLASTALPKINVPSRDDNLLRPLRPRTGPVPQTAPIKDAPPHLPGGSFDIRNNIDALVERVRAVAMADNRPSTPGSHIDWAGDDDDSLPDLDDWGVTPAPGAAETAEMISPIVVDGLKPLPDMSIESHASPPPLGTPELLEEPRSDDRLASKETMKTLDQVTKPSSLDPYDIDVATPITTTQQPLTSAPASAKVSLHPSLPAKPVVTADVSSILPNSRQGPGATSLRKYSFPTPLVATEKSAPASARQTAEEVELSPEPTVTVEQPAREQGLAESIHSPSAQDAIKVDPFANNLTRDGLTASMHAPPPGGISETKSAPSHISSYSSGTAEHRTHTRAHTVGRSPGFPRPEHNRPSRSGYSTPRGGLSAEGGYHSRTHSTPPAGLHGQRPNAHRPVITGDAISRLARTIGNTTLSPGRAAAVTATLN